MRATAHLARRFAGSLWPGGPPKAEEAWAQGSLLAGERALWSRLSGPDRRHAVAVGRRVEASLGGRADRRVLAAALLHDVGKLDAGLGTGRRVVATVVGLVRGRERAAAGDGRVARYLRHDAIGANLLLQAGSDPLTVCWAREHHLPPTRWSLDPAIAAALKAADDD